MIGKRWPKLASSPHRGLLRRLEGYPSNARLEAAFKNELAPYEVSGKGTIRFPISKRVPVRLITGIARFRAREIAEREKAAKKR
ncbi:MAG: hypothetical protein ACRD2N_26445 [Vicinamibacterales bacterium]